MKRSLPLLLLALVALTVAAHWPALQGEFIWDDDDHLTQNAAVRSPEGLRQIWSSLTVSRYYPLTLTTFWLEHRLWGLNPFPYHLVNLLLHALNAVLLFLLLRRWQITAAWLAAALWAIHPITVESVAWITELKNTQSGLFVLLTLLSYQKFTDTKRPAWYALAIVAFAAALTSKPSAVILPVVLLFLQFRRWHVIPFFLMSGIMAVLTLTEQNLHVQLQPHEDWTLTPLQRVFVASRALWFYAGKLLWPASLSFVYPRWSLEPQWLPVIGLILVALILWIVRRQPWARPPTFALGYFAVALLPVLGFADIYYFRYSFVADHFAYLAAPGLLVLVAVATARYRPVAAVLLIICGVLTWQHSRVFRNNEALWQDTLAKNSQSALAHNNLGNIYEKRGRLKEAETHLRAAQALRPGYPQVYNNLGVVLAQLDRLTEAREQFLTALKLQPDFPEAADNLAHVEELLASGQQTKP